jgi:hypothetical protein
MALLSRLPSANYLLPCWLPPGDPPAIEEAEEWLCSSSSSTSSRSTPSASDANACMGEWRACLGARAGVCRRGGGNASVCVGGGGQCLCACGRMRTLSASVFVREGGTMSVSKCMWERGDNVYECVCAGGGDHVPGSALGPLALTARPEAFASAPLPLKCTAARGPGPGQLTWCTAACWSCTAGCPALPSLIPGRPSPAAAASSSWGPPWGMPAACSDVLPAAPFPKASMPVPFRTISARREAGLQVVGGWGGRAVCMCGTRRRVHQNW